MTVNTFDPNKPNINLTEAVLSHIEKILKSSSASSGFRFTTKKAGCSGLSYAAELIDAPAADDIAIPNVKQLPIYVNKDSLAYLNGLTVDLIKKGLGQTQLVYRNPNETARCGCGESFSVTKSAKE